jgi:DNA-binding LacI/PurR family transcriptional regulator
MSIRILFTIACSSWLMSSHAQTPTDTTAEKMLVYQLGIGGWPKQLEDKEVAHKIAIAGFTNFNLVELFSPSLTSVKQPAFEMGQVATELLISMIEAKRPVTEFETRILNTELVKMQRALGNRFL